MAKSAYSTQEYKKSRGLTIIELMIAVSVLAVLLAIGLPDLRSFIISNRLSSDVKGFVGLVNYARSEAITRNQSVIICPKDNSAITCVDTANWGIYETQAFVDVDGSGDRNTGDILLKTLAAVDSSGLERGFVRTAAGRITIRSVGFSTVTNGLDVWAKKSGDAAYETKYGRRVCISKPGRVTVSAYNTTCADF